MPPTGRRSVPACMIFLTSAAAIPGRSIPGCSKKVLSSAERKASITRRGTAVTGTKTRFFRRELGEQPAVSGMDAAHHGRLVVGELGIVRQAAAIGMEQPDDPAAGEKADDDQCQSQYADGL